MSHEWADWLASGITGVIAFWTGWFFRGWVDRTKDRALAHHRHICRDCGEHFDCL